MKPANPDWKVQWREGRLKTPYRHFTAMVEGLVVELSMGFTCPPGYAFMVMKAWAASPDDAVDIVQVMSGQIGFTLTRPVYVFESEPALPPQNHPYGYDVDFTPFLISKP